MTNKERIEAIEMSTHKSWVDRAVYNLTPEAQIRREIKSIKENNRMMYSEGLITLEEFERVIDELNLLERMIFNAKDEGKRVRKSFSVKNLIYGSYIL